MAETVAVLGAGSWGTALAIQLARNGLQVNLWGHQPAHIGRLSELRENSEYLPGFPLPGNINPQANLATAVEHASCLLIAVPSKGFRDLLSFPSRTTSVTNAGYQHSEAGINQP